MTTEMLRRAGKGQNLLALTRDFTVVDIETTGLDPRYDEIIEISAIRMRDGEEVASVTSLICPNYEVDSYITELTGITQEMLDDAPTIDAVLPGMIEFIGEDVVVAHNAHFDINFIYDACDESLGLIFGNDFIDTIRIGRRLTPGLENYKLGTLASALGCSRPDKHRAYSDAQLAGECYIRLVNLASQQGVKELRRRISARVPTLAVVASDNADFDPDHLLYDKECVFTGVLARMKRRDAMQMVVDIGGRCADRVTKKSNFLILGNNDYNAALRGAKSSKQKKAEGMILSGDDMQILSENVFYDLMLE